MTGRRRLQRPGMRVHGKRDRADERGIGREPGGHELGREWDARAQGVLQARPQAIPRPDHAAADRDPHRVDADREVHHMESEFVDEVGHEAVEIHVVAARLEDLASRDRLAMGMVAGRTPRQRLPADHVLQRHPGGQRNAHVRHRAQVIADLAGGPVPARPGRGRQSRCPPTARSRDSGRRPGHSRPARPSGPPPWLPPWRPWPCATRAPGKAPRSSCPSASLSHPLIDGASSTRSSKGIPKVETPTAARPRSPAASARRARAARMPRSKLARAPSSPPLDDGGRRQPLAVKLAHRHGDLGPTEVKPEHYRGLGHVDLPVECHLSPR